MGLRLFFLPNFPGATFIPDARVLFHLTSYLGAKVGFFSESAMKFFQISRKNIPKSYPELEI